MKLRIIYNFFAIALLAFIFQSRSAGPATVQGLQVTGAPGSDGDMGTCGNSGCHPQGSFNPSLSIELLDDAGGAVDKYVPGTTYNVRITVTAGDGAPAAYGMQAVVLDAGENDVSNWTDVPSGLQTANVGGRNYLEQSSASQENIFITKWTAPAASTGAVTFYSAGLAINSNGNTAGDGSANSSLTVAEDDENSTSNLDRDFATINIYPNPVGEVMTLDITSRTAGAFEVNFADVSGKILRTETISLTSGKNEKSFNVSDLQKGYYLIQLCGDEHVTAKQMIKL